MSAMVQVFAHRGASGPHPEMTRAAFTAAIAVARERNQPLGLECDVHFTADGVLGCLHDIGLARTGRRADGSPVESNLVDLSVDELRTVDFGSWRDDLAATRQLGPTEREFMTLADLFDLVAEAREDGVEVGVAVETKHPVPRDADVEGVVADLLAERGWTGPGSGIRMITFDLPAVQRMESLLPALPQTYLIGRVERWQEVADGAVSLRPDIAIGVGGRVLTEAPQLVDQVHAAGRECHVWTVNEPDDIRTVLELGVDAVTSDHPDRVFAALA